MRKAQCGIAFGNSLDTWSDLTPDFLRPSLWCGTWSSLCLQSSTGSSDTSQGVEPVHSTVLAPTKTVISSYEHILPLSSLLGHFVLNPNVYLLKNISIFRRLRSSATKVVQLKIQNLKYRSSTHFFRTCTKIGTIQRRLAWPLCKDDTHINEAFLIFREGNFVTKGEVVEG